MTAWIIDASGDAYDADGSRGRLMRDQLLQCVRVEPRDAVDWIAFESATVSHAALVGLLYWLWEHPVRPTSVSQPGVPVARHFKTRGALLAFLAGQAEARAPKRAYSAVDVPFQQSPLADRIHAARGLCRSNVSAADQMTLLHHLFRGLFVISRFDKDCGDYRITTMGAGLRAYDPAFVETHIGRSFRESYDVGFGHWTADRYARMRSSLTPQAETVDAVIRWPGKAASRHVYNRLLLPYNVAEEAYLLTATELC